MTATQKVSFVLGAYLSAWLVSFVAFVGLDLSYVPSYFVSGWSLRGGELPSLVWLYSWPVFLAIVVVAIGFNQVRKRQRT